MRKRISDLLDACQDDSVELSGNTPLDRKSTRLNSSHKA